MSRPIFLSLLLATAAPVAAQEPDKGYNCEHAETTPVGQVRALRRIAIDGRHQPTTVVWGQWPYTTSRIGLRLTQPARWPAVIPDFDNATIDLVIRVPKRVRRAALLRVFPAGDNERGLTLATLVVDAGHFKPDVATTIGWARFDAYARGAQRLAWRLFRIGGRSDGELLGSGDIDLAPLALVRARLPTLLAALDAKAADFRTACRYEEIPYDPLGEI